MRVGIITTFLDNKKKTGIGNYLEHLLSELIKIAEKDEIFLIHYEKTNNSLYNVANEVLLSGFSPLKGKLLLLDLLRSIDHYRSYKKLNLDILHLGDPSTNITPFLFEGKYKVVTSIYDLTPILFPKSYKRLFAYKWKIMTTISCRKSDKIISISESTKNDLVNIMGIPEQNITVVHCAVGDNFKILDSDTIKSELAHKYGIKFPFLLFVGDLIPRKNIPVLLKAFSFLKKQGLPHYLVIVGSKGYWGYPAIELAMKELQLANYVRITDYVPSKDLPKFYNAASLFLYPSLYEGFGIPLLEAMACGTPVVTSNVSSMPEVVWDAAIIVDPASPKELADACINLLADSDLYQQLRDKGLKRVHQFNVKENAQILLDTYRAICT